MPLKQGSNALVSEIALSQDKPALGTAWELRAKHFTDTRIFLNLELMPSVVAALILAFFV